MIFFRVSNNINIKTTDGTLVTYNKFKTPDKHRYETIYMTTQSDFKDLEGVFKSIDKNKFYPKVLREHRVKKVEKFPIELGISNDNKYFQSPNISIEEQIKSVKKDEISLVIIGGVGKSISQIIASCTALRMLYEKLCEFYVKVKVDIYIDASNNSLYSRDKSIYERQDFFNKISPLAISLKKILEYDFFIDNSLFFETDYFETLNLVDAWLYKFGFEYENISKDLKYNQLNFKDAKIDKTLVEKIEKAKAKGKLLLYHPYSANERKSIPQTYAINILRQLVSQTEDYIIVSALSIDSKLKDDRFLDLSKNSKSLIDFMYIVSQMHKVISTDTSTYHISDTFMIPTVVLFTDENYKRKIKYYDFVKPIFIKDRSKNLSKFIFENDDLTIYKFESWKKLKVSKIIKLLESF